MATYWATTLAPLYQGCDGAIELSDLAADGKPLTAADFASATATLLIKAAPEVADADGASYDGAVDTTDPDMPVIRFQIPAADLLDAGNRWGHATLSKDSKRHLLGYGPVRVVDV